MPFYVHASLLNESFPMRVEVNWTEGFDGNSPILNYVTQHRELSPQGTVIFSNPGTTRSVFMLASFHSRNWYTHMVYG